MTIENIIENLNIPTSRISKRIPKIVLKLTQS